MVGFVASLQRLRLSFVIFQTMTVIMLGTPSTMNSDIHLDLLLLAFVPMNTVHWLRTGTPMQVLVCLVLTAAKIYAMIYLSVMLSGS